MWKYKITNSYNFRQNDLNHGGQGAPLTPIFHKFILQKLKSKNQIFDGIVNIGGISKLLILDKDKIFATDIGPGNCLMDGWCKNL